MEAKPQTAGSLPPPKPWEQGGSSSGPTPFKPSTPGKTSEVVESSGTARPGEIVTSSQNNVATRDAVGRPLPTRPWQQSYGNGYGGYGSNLNYGSTYGSGMYGSSYVGVGGGLYGNSMYGGYGGGLYGGSSLYGGSGLYGGGMYNNGFGGPMGGYGMGVGGPLGQNNPNNPFGPPSSPPSFWVSFLRVMHGVVTFFGRISILIDQNTQAFHMFMTALLQLFDRGGMLYGELARFVLRLLGIRTKAQSRLPSAPGMLPAPDAQANGHVQGSKGTSNSWDNVWEE